MGAVIRLDPSWVRAAVDAFLVDRLRRGEPGPAEEFARMAEPIYEMPPQRRDEAFANLFTFWLLRLEIPQRLEAIAAEFDPPLPQILVSQPAGPEAAFVNPEGSAVLVRVAPARASDPAGLTRWFRHELWRARDMLDSAFGYPREGAAVPGGPYQALVSDRYGLLWGIWTDARIERAGREPLQPSAEWERAFGRAFAKIPESLRADVFRAVRARPDGALDHATLVEWALRPERMVEATTGIPPGRLRLPGSPCPLCKFPTYRWVDPEAMPEAWRARVRERAPGWSPDAGLCERCLEYFLYVAA